jgi:hypothetical protein
MISSIFMIETTPSLRSAGTQMQELNKIIEAVGKRPSAALPSSLVTAAYFYVRLIPREFGSLASGHFPTASELAGFSTVSLVIF